MKITHPITRAALAVVALMILAVSVNGLISLLPLGNRGVDFTERKIHTLSNGTRSILSELDTPVVIRYYASRNTTYMPEALKLHMRRVDDLLKEYVSLSHGKLRVEHLDPQPDTDAEDTANLDRIHGQRMDDQNLYLGLSVSCLDRMVRLPFLDPNQETMLEHDLSKSIAEVSAVNRPKIGVMSALELKGGVPQMPGQAPMPSWVIYQQLRQAYDVEDIPMTASVIDPKQIRVLLLLHPASITPQTEFAIDQYLLAGGTVVACLDAHSIVSQMMSGGQIMMGGASTLSTLPTLLPAWGVKFETGKVLADPVHATRIDGNRTAMTVLTMNQESMPMHDSIITKDLENVTFLFSGAFTKNGKSGIEMHSLVRTTTGAGFVDTMKATAMDASLETSFKPSGMAYDLVTHLSGKFTSAFPNGAPKGESAAGTKAEVQPVLKEASAVGNVFLIADTDAFYDRFAYYVQTAGGMQMASPINGNASLLLNLLDQAVGSKYLIGSRSRAALRRPFTVVQKMEAEFNQRVGGKIEEFQAKQQAAQRKLAELQSKKTNSNDLYLSPEQEAEIAKLTQEQVQYAKLIREQQKELRRDKDNLAGIVTLLNVAVIPVMVVMVAVLVLLRRRQLCRAL
jgi:ABC-type uncharacterized transport system involved in gliding motility auxiliary subunit